MTGIDRLRAIAGAWDEWGLGGTLAEMADQIERERACDADTIENIRLIVGGVVDEMEHHILGHEGMEDSPVARWARELRGALKSDASDGSEAKNPSWHDPADAADVTSDAPKVTRDPAEDVSMSAYDLLPQEDREAIAWVREHGGLESVKKLLDWVVGHCSTKQQLDFDFWLSGRVMYELGFEEDMADRDEVERRLLARLMPEGCEWPRYESGESVGFGDDVSRRGEDFEVNVIALYRDGSFSLNFWLYSKDERVKRHAPAVLAADGEPLEVGQTVYNVGSSEERVVDHIEYEGGGTPNVYYADGGWDYPDLITHQHPVLDADGVPINVGDTVWYRTGAAHGVVESINANSILPLVVYRGDDGELYRDAAEDVTHTKPEPPDSRQAVVNEIGDEMAARIDLLVSSGRWSDAD